MNLSSQLFFMELITTATGSLILLLWWIFQKPCLQVNPKVVFITIHVVLFMCLIPVGYFMVRLNFVNSYITENGSVNLNFKRTRILNYGFCAILAGWILLGINRLVRYCVQIAGDIRLRRGNVPEDKEEVLEIFEELKDKLGISEKVVLEQNDMIRTPCAMGILHPCVVLPYTEECYDRKDLEIILSHELTHIRFHDIWYKLLTAVIVGIECFNPLIFFLFRCVGQFCENRCDVRVNETMQDSFSSQEYFGLIFSLQLRLQELEELTEKNTSYLTSMLVSKSSLERRVEFMKIYRKGKVSKVITAALTMVFIASSALTAEDSVNTNIEYMGDYSNSLMRGSQAFNWNVRANTRSCTSKFNLASGVEISISATVRPSDSTFWMGIMYDKDGTGWYIVAKKDASYTFKVDKDGAYRAFVENRSDVKITASGSYNYD